MNLQIEARMQIRIRIEGGGREIHEFKGSLPCQTSNHDSASEELQSFDHMMRLDIARV